MQDLIYVSDRLKERMWTLTRYAAELRRNATKQEDLIREELRKREPLVKGYIGFQVPLEWRYIGDFCHKLTRSVIGAIEVALRTKTVGGRSDMEKVTKAVPVTTCWSGDGRNVERRIGPLYPYQLLGFVHSAWDISNHCARWTQEEDRVVLGKEPVKEIARRLGRTKQAISNRRRKLRAT